MVSGHWEAAFPPLLRRDSIDLISQLSRTSKSASVSQCSSGPSSSTSLITRISTLLDLEAMASLLCQIQPTSSPDLIQASEKLDPLAMLPTIRDRFSSL